MVHQPPPLPHMNDPCSAFICPITVQHILVKHDSMEDFTAGWQIVFLKASSMHLFGALFYACFASGEVSPFFSFARIFRRFYINYSFHIFLNP